MITFGIHTYRAQINAMPCPPDDFQIVVTQADKLMISRIECPVIAGYSFAARDDKFSGNTFIVYFKPPDSRPTRISVQDMILNSMAKVNWNG